MSDVQCPGLNGASMLGFLAALGVLEVLNSTRGDREPSPQLWWSAEGVPSYRGAASVDAVTRRILEDAHGPAVDSLLTFRYVKREKAGPKLTQALVPPVAVLRPALRERLEIAPPLADALGTLTCEAAYQEVADEKQLTADDLRSHGVPWDDDVVLDLAAAPTPFDFTSRNTQFLDQIGKIRDVLTPEIVTRELQQGQGAPVVPIMRWDALVDLPGAIFGAVRPLPHPAAEWLAFRGLACFPLVADRRGARAPGMIGRRKDGQFSWVLWEAPLDRDVVRSVLGVRWATTMLEERAARGVVAGFTVDLRKDATGYDGAVSPSRPLGSPSPAR